MAGLFLVSLATLMHEILLTRIFSVTLWYHFAFMAISVAMFGGAAGAILVYVRPGLFPLERTREQLAAGALLFAFSVVAGFATCLRVPTLLLRLEALPYVSLIYCISAIPFVFGGIVVCLGLTRFPRQTGVLYAADLAGASLGCLLLIGTLGVTDGPTAVLVVAAVAGVGAVAFSLDHASPRLRALCLAGAALLAAGAFGHLVLVRLQEPLLRFASVKGTPEAAPLFESWTSFARIRVEGRLGQTRPPFGWGFGPAYTPPRDVQELDISIDAASGTVLTAFDGDTRKLDYLKYDVTNVAHHLRPDARVLVVGAGGGRDVLSALAFDQRSVEAIEVNGAILHALRDEFGEFAGHLDRHPRVTLVHDEARSRLARERRTFDIIQVSLIDTWAATAAGAFVLTENSLYTVEAWRTFLERLEPRGVLSFSRWYRPREPHEFYRLVGLAATSLMARGLKSPRNHLAVLTAPSRDEHTPIEVGTLLVSAAPFSAADVLHLQDLRSRLGFRLVLSPGEAQDPVLARIASGDDLTSFVRSFTAADISPPTDDRPFFFQTMRISDVWKGDVFRGAERPRSRAILLLGLLVLTVVGLTTLGLVLPLLLTTRRETLRGSLPLFVYFLAVGLGFMFVEVAQMQRLSLFLGHPTYSLSVVLFSLLLSSGLGSMTARGPLLTVGAARMRLAGLVIALLGGGLATPWVVGGLQAMEAPIRVLAAIALLGLPGFLMGMAVPLGLRVAESRVALSPWLWGMNGAASVCASVIGVVISLGAGITATFWTGWCAYLAAWVAFARATRTAAT